MPMESHEALLREKLKTRLSDNLRMVRAVLNAPENRDVVLRPFRIAKSCGCRFYCGSDAHHPGSFENCRAIFERAIDRLGLQESDKFHIERA